jgi:transcription antitermination factor NusG
MPYKLIGLVANGAKLYLRSEMGISNVPHAILNHEIDLEHYHRSAIYAQERWYVAYTCANFEKRVAAELEAREVEHFLPLYTTVRRWKDRRVNLSLPLFPGYIFVRLAIQDRLSVLKIPNIVRLIGFGGLPTALSDEEVEILRSGLTSHLHVEPHPFLTLGRRVRIVKGPLAGFQGILRRRRNNFRFVVSVELIRSAFAVDVDATDVQPL